MLRSLTEKAALLCGLETAPGDVVAVTFVGPRTISELNHDFVGHEGLTDVICFNYNEAADIPGIEGEERVSVELFVCSDVAAAVGAERKDSSYSREMVLYLVHGLLHAAGEDDLDPVSRRRMRSRERSVLKKLGSEFDFAEVFPPLAKWE